MEKHTTNGKQKGRMRQSAEKWRIGDYIRQLSIVIIGIVVTFSGSNLISKIQTRREIKQTVRLLHAELAKNLEQLDNMYDFTTKDFETYNSFVRNYIDHTDRIPRDSVSQYFSVLSHSRTYRHQTNALETMKNSAGIQEISNREIVLDIFNCYDELDGTFRRCNNLYDYKSDVVRSVYHSLDRSVVKNLFDNADAYKAIEAMVIDQVMYNYIRNNVSQLSSLIARCDATRKTVRETISMLEREF